MDSNDSNVHSNSTGAPTFHSGFDPYAHGRRHHHYPTQFAHPQPEASTSVACERYAGQEEDSRIRSQTCERCRSRRSRCVSDGASGVCRACREAGVECVYTGIDKRRQSTKRLRARLNTWKMCSQSYGPVLKKPCLAFNPISAQG